MGKIKKKTAAVRKADWRIPFRHGDIVYDEPDGLIICGDCRDVLPKFPAKSVDLVLTDPPYGLVGDGTGKVQLRNDGICKPDYGDWDLIADHTWVKLIDATSLVMFHDQKHATTVHEELQKANYHFRHYLFWYKGDGGINPRRNFVNTIEMASFATKRRYIWNGGGASPNTIRCNRAHIPIHPT